MSDKTTRCDCGQRTAQECAEMPSRHCGLWGKTTEDLLGDVKAQFSPKADEAHLTPPRDKTTIAWRLMAFDKNTERLVTDVTLTNDQLVALRPYLGMANTDDHFGSYPVSNVLWFAEEFVE